MQWRRDKTLDTGINHYDDDELTIFFGNILALITYKVGGKSSLNA